MNQWDVIRQHIIDKFSASGFSANWVAYLFQFISFAIVYYLVFKNIEIYLPFHLIGFHITANRPRPKQNMSQRIRGTKIYLSVIRTSESDYYCIVRQQPRHFATTKNRLYLHNQKRKQWIKTRYYPA